MTQFNTSAIGCNGDYICSINLQHALTPILRELRPAAHQSVAAGLHIVTGEQFRADRSDVQKAKTQERQLHPVCNNLLYRLSLMWSLKMELRCQMR